MTKRNIIYLEYLRFFATVAVISIHVTSGLVTNYNANPHYYWWVGSAINGLSRWCVPVFLMISGALILSPTRDEEIMSFFKNRLVKVLIPFLLSAVFYYWWANRGHIFEIPIGRMIKDILRGPIYYHLWYVYMLIGLLLITPILRIFTKHAERKHIELFLIIWSLLMMVDLLNELTGIKIGINANFVGGYVGFFILGHYIQNYEISKRMTYIIYALGILGGCGALVGTYTLLISDPSHRYLGYYFQYTTINIAALAAAIFIFLKNWKFSERAGLIRRIIFKFGGYSYFIYLIHPIVKDLIFKFLKINVYTVNPIVGYFLDTSLILIVSYGISKVIVEGMNQAKKYSINKSNKLINKSM